MVKGQFCAALLTCLLATSSVSAILNLDGVLQPVRDTLNITAETLSQTLGEDVLTNVLATATGIVDNAFKAVNNLTRGTVKQLIGTVNNTVAPSNISQAFVANLLPQFTAISNLTNVLRNIPKAVGCASNVTLSQVATGVITGISEAVQCTNSLNKELTAAVQSVISSTQQAVNFSVDAVTNATRCLEKSDASNIVSCVSQPINAEVKTATNVLRNTKDVVNEIQKSAVKVPACAVNVLTARVNKGNGIIQTIVRCAKDLGVDAVLPNLPGVTPDLTAIYQRTVRAINNATETLIGPNGSVNALNSILQKLLNVTSAVGSDAVNAAVNRGLDITREAIKQVSQSSTNSATSVNVERCALNANNSAAQIGSDAKQLITTCTDNVVTDAALFVGQTAAFDIRLKGELVTVGISAVTRCLPEVLKLGDALERCVDAGLTEFEEYITQRRNEINILVGVGEKLIVLAGSCLSDGLSILDEVGQAIVDDFRLCIGA